MEDSIVKRRTMKPVSERTSKGRAAWVAGTLVGGATLLGAALFFHGTPAKPPRTLLIEAPETAAAVTTEIPPGSTLPSGAPATARLPQPEVEAPSAAAPLNAPATTAAESAEVESLTEEHPGRSKQAEQTPAWKGQKTRAILRVVEDRVERVEKEATELERAGDVEGAANQRVLLARLKRQISTMNDEIVAYSKAEPAEMR